MYQVPHFINGSTVDATDRMSNIYHPATGEIAGQVSMADTSLISQTVAAAQKAFLEWSKLSTQKRARLLFQFRTVLESHIDELATLVTNEHGKTLDDARASVQRGIEVVSYACGISEHLLGNFSANIASSTDNFSLRQPLGVCLGITPFNFPAMVPLWMFPLAIACGNTFIVKPSEKDPSCAVRIAQLASEAGVPDGVVNVLHGDGETVNALLHHPDIRAVSFVGSTKVAEYVYQTAIQQGKRAQTFGGAKNHCIVMPDVELDPVADSIVGAAYGSAGERCMAISVAILVGDKKFADEMSEKISARVKKLRIGPGNQKNIDMGPLITREHRDNVCAWVEKGVQEGAKLIVDGRSFISKESPQGFYLGGCLFDDVDISMQVWREEIFGPVLCLMRAPDFNTALHWVNQHLYGNGSAIFTRDAAIARAFYMQVQTGMVGVNIPIPVPVASHSFGGWKKSRFGDIHLFGSEGVQFYTQLKTVMQRWPETALTGSFHLPTH
ncbi:MAG: CoA-acylating methylmalonate-semialdehyde dehydrogenase [Gammaproteobacteria bacterium]|nr:CoA-acylating methylmalonate-semialdehyde dehydrogenase [Gammaproteobacteria bacterium]